MKTQQEIDKLKNEFAEITTLRKRLGFWRDKLGFEYYDSFSVLQDNQWLLPFFIKPENHRDTEDLNEYYLDLFNHRNPNALLEVDSLINAFENRLREVSNKKELIEIELQDYTQFKDANERKYFNSFLLNNDNLDLKAKEIKPNEIYRVYNTHTKAKFVKYLKTLLNPNSEKLIQKSSQILQMLLLDYLGVGINLNLNNVQKAKLYSPIINRDFESTRQYFSKLESSKKKSNLIFIRDLMEEIGLSDIAEIVENDINKFQKKK